MKQLNLNEACITTEAGDEPMKDNSQTSNGVTVYFRNLRDALVGHINRAHAVVGCVAWLTCPAILNALASVKKCVSIVVQKEDFLRPDYGAKRGWKAPLRQLYAALPEFPSRFSAGGLVASLSQCYDPTLQAVRCVGNHNRAKLPAFPRMHNKFLVFCDVIDHTNHQDQFVTERYELKPYAVWTGSFNLTTNAGMSLENALYLTDQIVVRAYLSEWEQIVALSEPLDWETDWMAPEWRIGT